MASRDDFPRVFFEFDSFAKREKKKKKMMQKN